MRVGDLLRLPAVGGRGTLVRHYREGGPSVESLSFVGLELHYVAIRILPDLQLPVEQVNESQEKLYRVTSQVCDKVL